MGRDVGREGINMHHNPKVPQMTHGPDAGKIVVPTKQLAQEEVIPYGTIEKNTQNLIYCCPPPCYFAIMAHKIRITFWQPITVYQLY